MVGDFIDCSWGEWKIDLIRHMFLPHEAEIILVMPLSSTLPNDSLTWNSTANGIFSIRSSYKVVMDLRDHQDTSGGSSDSDIKKFWRRIWSIQIPSKVKKFG